MKEFDAVVIGGGVLGCFAARNLCRWDLRVALAEAAEDICGGITRANAAVCYAGYDHAPGSLKAIMTLAANAKMDSLCEMLEVPFLRRGGLMPASGPRGETILKKKLEQGNACGVPGLALLTGAEAREREPMLSETVTAALYSPTTGTVNPWQLGIAAFENAVHNGCVPFLGTAVQGIRKTENGYLLETDGEEITCRAVVNCAGLRADAVRELLFAPGVRLRLDASDFLVLDRHARTPSHILFQESEDGKGITAVPTAEGNLLLESPARALKGQWFSADPESLAELGRSAKALLPSLDLTQVIRSFGAVRPNPYMPDGRSIRSFVTDAPEKGFLSLMGIKTPGLTCADQLGRYAAERIAEYLGAEENKAFDPCRKAILRLNRLPLQERAARAAADPACGRVVCRCEDITEAEIREAIARGAVSLDGIKRRLGAGMGPCQGSRCAREMEKLLGEYGHGTC